MAVEPLIEEHSLTSDRVNSVIEIDAVPSIVLPKNPWVARQLTDYTGYSQTVKTWYFKYLIPLGAENNASIQQWWDAHAYVHTILRANLMLLNRLCPLFAQIIQSEGERIIYRAILRTEHFTPTQGRILI